MTLYLIYVTTPIFVNFIMSAFLGRQKIDDNDKIKKLYLVICGIITALMIGLRDKSVGPHDSTFYYTMWETMSTIGFPDIYDYIQSTDLELGYQLFVWIVSHVFSNGQWLFIISGFFFSFAVCMFVYKNSQNVTLSLLVFNCLGLFHFFVQGLRQTIAMCICLWAIEQCKKKKLINFLLIVILAALFHASAYVFGIVYILSKLKINFSNFIFVFIMFLLSILLMPDFFDLLNFVMNDDYVIGDKSTTGGIVAILIYLFIIIFGVLFRDNVNAFYPLFIYMTVAGCASMIFRNTFNGISERISFYFAFAQMIIIPNSIETIRDVRSNVLIKYIVVLLCIGVAVYKASYSVLLPYEFFWQVV